MWWSLALGLGAAAWASDEVPSDEVPTDESPTDEAPAEPDKKPKKDRWPKVVGVPIPMVSPVLGFGLGALGMVTYKLDPDDKVSPPSATLLFGMYSTSKTWAAGGAQRLYLDEDNWRVLAGAGYFSANYTYFGVGESLNTGIEIPMGTDAFVTAVKVHRRVYGRFYLGLGWKFMSADVSLEPLPDNEITTHVFENGPLVLAEYDRRDNVFSATKGWHIESSAGFVYPAFGSDVSYTMVELAANAYWSITDPKYVLAGRVFWKQGFGDVPIWDTPAMGMGADLRGYEYGTYRDKVLLAAQAEFRWNFVWRFGLVVFGGLGTVTPSWTLLGDAPALPSYGLGLRFNVYPEQRIMLMLDYGRGNSDGYFYFGIGEAF